MTLVKHENIAVELVCLDFLLFRLEMLLAPTYQEVTAKYVDNPRSFLSVTENRRIIQLKESSLISNQNICLSFYVMISATIRLCSLLNQTLTIQQNRKVHTVGKIGSSIFTEVLDDLLIPLFSSSIAFARASSPCNQGNCEHNHI